MLLKVHSASLTGLRAQILDIEVDISNSHKFHYQVVGLPDTAVRESGDRVRAATRNCGFSSPLVAPLPSTWHQPTSRRKAPVMTCQSLWRFWGSREKSQRKPFNPG